MSTIIGKATASTAVVAPGNYISCYILNKLNDTLIQFVVIPEDLSESYSANYNTEEIIGRTAPYISYTQSGARTFNYSVKLHRDLVEDFD